MLRSRFESLPEAFNERLIPSDANKSKGFRAAFSSRPKVFVSIVRLGIMGRSLTVQQSINLFHLTLFCFQASGDEREREKRAARFAQMWNVIITSFREEDLIDNREMDLLLVPYCKDRELNIFQWPPFLLASKVVHLALIDFSTYYFCGFRNLLFICFIVDPNSTGYGSRQWWKRS